MRRVALFVVAVAAMALGGAAISRDPLPSWRAGEAKMAVLNFVAEVSDPSGPDYVPKAERVALFEGDGTLWADQPVDLQFLFVIDAAKARAAADPGWAATPALQAAAKGDVAAVFSGEAALVEVATAIHSDASVVAFTAKAAVRPADARQPAAGRPFTEMVYAPMLELVDHLRSNGFSVYIVSGGGVDFMRAIAETAYGVPPQIGSLGRASFASGAPAQAAAFTGHIGRLPILAAGNSDDDMAMLQWATAGAKPRLGLIVHHTNSDRESAPAPEGPVGRSGLALETTRAAGWIVIDAAAHWHHSFKEEPVK